MNHETEQKILKIAIHATIMVAKLEEFVGIHPDDSYSEEVVHLEDIQEIIKEFKEKAYPGSKK